MFFASLNRCVAMIRAFLQKDWLPSFALLLIMMITLICATCSFMLMPSLSQISDIKNTAEKADNAPQNVEAQGESNNGKLYALPELVTNVGDTLGSRFIVANLTLVGATKVFAKENEDKIMDLSSGILARIKPDMLEKPLNREMLKNEILTELRRVLGGAYIKDIYFTRLAIQ